MVRDAEELAEAVRRFVRAVERAAPVERVILFGSYAAGTQRAYSDIDLAVISPAFEALPLLEAYRLLYLAKDESDLLIQPLPLTPAEISAPAPGSLAAEILRAGKVVYEGPRRAA
jgi:predicted nucleotidyltransferase